MVTPNEKERERNTTIRIVAGPEENRSVQTFTLTQDIRASNPHYALTGKWNLYYDGNVSETLAYGAMIRCGKEQ